MVQNGFMKNWNFILELCPIFIVLRNVIWREPAHIFLHLLHCPRHFYLSSNIVYSCNLRYVPCFFSVSLCTNAVYLHQPIQFIFKKRTLHFQNLTPTPNAIPLGKKRDKKIYILNIYIVYLVKVVTTQFWILNFSTSVTWQILKRLWITIFLCWVYLFYIRSMIMSSKLEVL